MATVLQCNEHPYRTALYDEIHNRPFPRVGGPISISHLAVVNGESSKEQRIQHLARLAEHCGTKAPPVDADCFYRDLGDIDIRWEQHTEFSTYTFIRESTEGEIFERPPWDYIEVNWCQQLPGQVITAIHLELVDSPEGFPELTEIQAHFEDLPLIGGGLPDERGQVWSTFRLHSDNFGRVVIYNKKLNENDAGRLLRNVLELTSYRVMTLLAFPLARDLIPEITKQEVELADLIERVTCLDSKNEDRKLLDELSLLSARLEKRIAETNYRFDATKAYFELTTSRLEELSESPIEHAVTIREFLSRRLTPAYRTSMSVRERMQKLSDRIERASNLLRTRVSIALEEQNRALLKSMDRRGFIQLRLQQTVEGLSVVAITYYLIQLLEYLVVTSRYWKVDVEQELLIALAVPMMLVGVWLSMRAARRRWESDKERK